MDSAPNIRGLTLRPYQDEALRWSLERERSILCLPTGLGKTLVAAAWMCKVLERGYIRRILVIEPSRILVEQNHDYLLRYTTLTGGKVYGVWPPEERGSRWNAGQFTVCTAQTALNDITLLDHDAIVVDECHHATGMHAFAQLMEQHPTFKWRLGLSATIPHNIEPEICRFLGEIRRYSWSDPNIKEYIPSWYGEVLDAEFEAPEQTVWQELQEAWKEMTRSQLQGLLSFAMRTLCRDGGLALAETAKRASGLGGILRERGIGTMLGACRPLHKLSLLEIVLRAHEFEKAILFVDRVVVANAIAERFSGLNPTLVLGRLHGGAGAQEQALQDARRPECRLVVSTSAGEEGLDLPETDLLVIWSNTVSSLRFIQRMGRAMRKDPHKSEKPKAIVYLATPDTRDYEALREGLVAAKREGVEVSGVDLKAVIAKSIVGRIETMLSIRPMRHDEVQQALAVDEKHFKKGLDTGVREGVLFYVYNYPPSSPNRIFEGFARAVSEGALADDEIAQRGARFRARYGGTTFVRADRYYAPMGAVPFMREEVPELFRADKGTCFSIIVKQSMRESEPQESWGAPEELMEKLRPLCSGDMLYLACAGLDFQVSYHGRFTPEALEAVLRNFAHLVEEEKKSRD